MKCEELREAWMWTQADGVSVTVCGRDERVVVEFLIAQLSEWGV